MATKPKYSVRPDGRVATRIKIGTKPDGNPDYKYLCARSEKELDAKVNSYAKQTGTVYFDPDKTSLTVWLTHWLDTVKKGTVRQNTWEFYRGIINSTLTPEIGAKTLAKLQPADIRTMYARLQQEGLSASRIHSVHVTLNSALKIAVEDGIISINPCSHSTVRVKAKKADKKKELFVFTQEQVEALLKTLSGWWKAFTLLAWATGMRREELLGLRWMDVDAKKCTVSVVQTVVVSEDEGIHIGKPKNDASYRTILIDKPCIAELLRFRAKEKETRRVVGFMQHNTDLVFGIDGKLPDPRKISKEFKTLAIAAGLPSESHLHTLRHTHATQLLRAGVHPKKVQARLGHATYQMTMDLYSHVTPDMQDGIAEILTGLRAKK